MEDKPALHKSLYCLVVDDNLIEQAASVAVIQQAGIAVDAVSNGIEAIELAYRIPYDLIFMDLDMPGINGFETTRVIRTLPEMRGWVPIMALTMSKEPEDVRRCFQCGMSNFILKALTLNNLYAAISPYAVDKLRRPTIKAEF
jgi:CheY-like chemotaxis protein